MEEEDEQEKPKMSWSDTSLAKSIGWVFAIVGVLATVAGVVFTVYTFSKEPTTILSATYTEARFVIPDKLGSKGYIDSILVERDDRIASIYRALKSHLNPREIILLPDSLRPYGLQRSLYSNNKFDNFIISHHYFYVLNIKNEGDKVVDRLHLIHGTEAYYEFKDSGGVLKKGHSAGNLPLGDLAATESREVYLWTLSRPFLLNAGLTVTYDAGKVQAKPIAVNGNPIIEAQSPDFQFAQFISYFLLGFIAFSLFQLFKVVFTKRS